MAEQGRGGKGWRKCSCCEKQYYWMDPRGDLDFTTSAMPEENLALLKEAGVKRFNLGGMSFGMVGPIVETWQIPGDFVRFVREHRGEVVGVNEAEEEVICAFFAEEDAEEFKRDLVGREFASPEFTGMCQSCENRGGLCMHNAIGGRYLGLEPGTFEVKMHRSKPHWDASGAADPATCRWCNLETPVGRDLGEIRRHGREE